jgi:outer membrane protein OmpA-like peptidoglycan-associated protein
MRGPINAAAAMALFAAQFAVLLCSPAKAECLLLSQFNHAIATKDVGRARAIEAQITVDPVCGPLSLSILRQRASLEVQQAEALSGQSGSEAEREQLLVSADRPEAFWAASASLAELRFAQRRFAEASRGYERAIEIIKNLAKTPVDPGVSVKQELLQRAAEARLLAANDEAGGDATYVPAARDVRDGKLGGMFSEDLRGLRPESIPLPINFETASAKLTPEGLQCAAELLTAIKEQRPGEILIVGHTDERGGDEYNMRLSDARARAVAAYLKANGIQGEVKVIARGKTEPLKIASSAGLTQQDMWALNRRVEWRRH